MASKTKHVCAYVRTYVRTYIANFNTKDVQSIVTMHNYTITYVQGFVASRTYFNKLLCEVAESELVVSV